MSRNLIDKAFIRENLKKISTQIPICIALICPHLSSEACNCRKPNTGLIDYYRKEYRNSCKKEIFIGDQETDEECAKQLKIPFIQINNSFSVFNGITKVLENF